MEQMPGARCMRWVHTRVSHNRLLPPRKRPLEPSTCAHASGLVEVDAKKAHRDISDQGLRVAAVVHRQAVAAAPSRGDQPGVRLRQRRDIIDRCVHLS